MDVDAKVLNDWQNLCFQLFIEAGFKWEDDWTSCKDYQHFEWIEK